MPQSDDEFLVGVSPADLAIIITGLREMPEAVDRMADAVSVLAETSNKSTTKSWMATILLSCTVVMIATTAIFSLLLSNTVGDVRTIQKENSSVLSEVKDCLDYTTDGHPHGECAKRNLDMFTALSEYLRQDVKCQSEIQFYNFLLANPGLGVVPAPVSEECRSQGD